mgnify:CR=1 FL=1
MIAVALVLLSISQSFVLLLIGPLFKSLFTLGVGESFLYLRDLIPRSIDLGSFSQLKVARQDLAVGVPVCLLLAVVIKGLAGYFFHYNQQSLAFYVAKRYRDRLFAAIMSQPYAEISKKNPGDWMSLVMNDVLYLQSRFSEIVSSIVKDSVLILSAFAVMLLLHWQTALLMIFGSPLLLWYLGRKGKKISGFADDWQRRLADMSSRILSLRLRFNFIRAQQGEQRELNLFKALNQEYYGLIRKSIYLRSVIGPGIELGGVIVFALFLYLISKRIWLDSFEPTELIQFLGAMALLLKPLKILGEQFARIQETVGALKEGLRIFERTANKPSSSVPEDWSPINSAVELKELHCGYDENVRLAASGLTVSPGRSIAVVGPSGAGKSTLVKTLVGLLEPIKWEANVSWEDLSRSSSFVSQNPFLFSDSVRGNLCYGIDSEVPDLEIWSVLSSLGLKELVESLDGGLDSQVESVRSNFSGGQLQRFVLCRSLLQDRQFLILDEATSALDADNEKIMTEVVLDSCKEKNKAIIFITHRLRWLHLFDEIYFVENGKVALKGNYSQLMAESRFSEFVALAQD